MQLSNRGASVNHIDSASQTPLILAAKLGKVDICDELLNNGADCFRQDSYHNNALFCAIMNKHHAVVEVSHVRFASREIYVPVCFLQDIALAYPT